MTSPGPNAPARYPQQGFSLIECLVALGLIGSALIIAAAYLNVLATSSAQVRAHTEMLHEIEATVERVRSGMVPLRTGTVPLAWVSGDCPDLLITMVVERRPEPGLYRIVVRGECMVRDRLVSRSLMTSVWRP